MSSCHRGVEAAVELAGDVALEVAADRHPRLSASETAQLVELHEAGLAQIEIATGWVAARVLAAGMVCASNPTE
jgi:hypothetical protein